MFRSSFEVSKNTRPQYLIGNQLFFCHGVKTGTSCAGNTLVGYWHGMLSVSVSIEYMYWIVYPRVSIAVTHPLSCGISDIWQPGFSFDAQGQKQNHYN